MNQLAFASLVLLLLLIVFIALYGFMFARSMNEAFMLMSGIFILLACTLAAFWNVGHKIALERDIRLCHRQSTQRLVLISIDGLHMNYLGTRWTPTLNRHFVNMAANPKQGLVGVTPTLTYPTHTTLVTGVHPSEHGITNNTSLRDLTAWKWFSKDIKVPTIFDECHAQGLTTMSIQWPVMVGNRALDYTVPLIWRSRKLEDLKLIDALTRPAIDFKQLFTGIKQSELKMADLESIQGDRLRCKIAVDWMVKYKPGFMAVYFAALDYEQHEHGPYTPQAWTTLHQLDQLIAKVLDKVPPDVPVCIVSDHGFVAVHTRVDFSTVFPASLLRHWTLWPADGCVAIVPAASSSSTNKEEAEHDYQTMLTMVTELPSVETVIEQPDLTQRYHAFPEARALIALQPGYSSSTESVHRGGHGYLPHHAALNGVCLVSRTTTKNVADRKLNSVTEVKSLLHDILFTRDDS